MKLLFEFVTLPGESKPIFINMQAAYMCLLPKIKYLRGAKKGKKN